MVWRRCGKYSGIRVDVLRCKRMMEGGSASFGGGDGDNLFMKLIVHSDETLQALSLEVTVKSI